MKVSTENDDQTFNNCLSREVATSLHSFCQTGHRVNHIIPALINQEMLLASTLRTVYELITLIRPSRNKVQTAAHHDRLRGCTTLDTGSNYCCKNLFLKCHRWNIYWKLNIFILQFFSFGGLTDNVVVRYSIYKTIQPKFML